MSRELTNVAIEHWCDGEGYGIRIAWEEGIPNLYLLEAASQPSESVRDTESPILGGNGCSGNELCDSLPCRRMWLGPLNPDELTRFLMAAKEMETIFKQ